MSTFCAYCDKEVVKGVAENNMDPLVFEPHPEWRHIVLYNGPPAMFRFVETWIPHECRGPQG